MGNRLGNGTARQLTDILRDYLLDLSARRTHVPLRKGLKAATATKVGPFV